MFLYHQLSLTYIHIDSRSRSSSCCYCWCSHCRCCRIRCCWRETRIPDVKRPECRISDRSWFRTYNNKPPAICLSTHDLVQTDLTTKLSSTCHTFHNKYMYHLHHQHVKKDLTAVEHDKVVVSSDPWSSWKTNDDGVSSIGHFGCPSTVVRSDDVIGRGILKMDVGTVSCRTVDELCC